MTIVSRRQFGAGAAALATAAALPVPVQTQTAKAAITYPAFISGLNGEAARVARRMARLDHLFIHVDAHYFTNDRSEWRWSRYYEELIKCAQWAFEPDHDPPTQAERAFIAWARERIPNSDDLRQEPWRPIAGLSPAFRERETWLNECLIDYALAAMAYDYVTFDRLQNPLRPEHDEIAAEYRRSFDRLRVVLRGEPQWSGPWGWPPPENASDLKLLRRVWHIFMDADEVYRSKLLPQALAQLKERGVTWETTDDGRSNRTWTWVHPA